MRNANTPTASVNIMKQNFISTLFVSFYNHVTKTDGFAKRTTACFRYKLLLQFETR